MVLLIIFKDILLCVAKQDLNHSGHEKGMIKETKIVRQIPAALDLLATAPTDVFQNFLNLPHHFFFFFNRFWQSARGIP